MANFPSVNMLQINLNQSREIQDLAIQTAREREVGILVISEQNRDLYDAMWYKDKRDDAVIDVCKEEHYTAREVISGNGYADVALGRLTIFSIFSLLSKCDRAGRARPGCAKGIHSKMEGPTYLGGWL